MLCMQAQGKAKEEEREDGEITESERQVKAEEKRQKAREDMEAAQRELKVRLLQLAGAIAASVGVVGLTLYRLFARRWCQVTTFPFCCAGTKESAWQHPVYREPVPK